MPFPQRSTATVRVPARTCGTVDPICANPDQAARLWLIARDTEPGRYTLPFRITWGNRYLGQFRHAIARVTA